MLSIAIVILMMLGQAPTSEANFQENSAERLKFMKRSVESYQFVLQDRSEGVPKIQAEPAFRLGKQPADNLEEGAIFFWTAPGGRPEAAIQVFMIRDKYYPQGLWIHEFTSLATTPFALDRNGQAYWSPTQPGVVFQPVPGAPVPSDSAAGRMRQMSELVKSFHASDNFKRKGWSELRLLTRPISRYGKPGTRLLDGALFGFVLGTDPEVLLFLEARPSGEKSGLEWQYAFAPMTCFAVKGSCQGKMVWELADREPADNPGRPFFDKTYEP